MRTDPGALPLVFQEASRAVAAGEGTLLLGLESPSGCFLVDEVSGTYVAP